MNTLREAAQGALFWMQHARLHLTIKERLHPDGLIQYDNAARNLRAALAQPETTAEPVAWAVTCDGSAVEARLTETAANLIAQNLREQTRGRDFDWQTTPLYAHPPRDEWRDVQPSHKCSSLCSPDETFCAITKDGKCDAMDRSCDAVS